MRRTSLAVRIGLLVLGVVVVVGIVAGTVATRLARSSANSAALQNLARLAYVGQTLADRPATERTRGTLVRTTRAFAGLNVGLGVAGTDGVLHTAKDAKGQLVRNTVTPADITKVLAGGDVQDTRDGGTLLLEGRPTEEGGIFLVQRRADATAPVTKALRRFLVALAIAGGIALALGLLLAWTLARSLRRTAAAAHALADGRRDVVLPLTGPTEVTEVSAAVNTLTTALARSEQRQREFLLSVSHDLRTPLTAIAGYGESLADGVVPPEDVPRVSNVVLAEARRLERLVADLLDLARLDARDLRVDLAPTDLVGLVRSAAVVWADRCAAEGVQFALEAPTTPLHVVTDPARLRQALDGLFDNALRVTPAGRPIVLAARTVAATAVVEVRDGGPGLREQDLAVAFDQGVLHERYRGVREVGTGLGLAIVHRLVARLGGSVEAGHATEGGARFTVRLPLG